VPVDAVITFQDGSTTRVKTELQVVTLLPTPERPLVAAQ
jgi:long-chain acyl-CoA synthetase